MSVLIFAPFFIVARSRQPGTNRVWLETQGGWSRDSILILDDSDLCEVTYAGPGGDGLTKKWRAPAGSYQRVMEMMDRGSLWGKNPDVLSREVIPVEKLSERWADLVLTGTPNESKVEILMEMRLKFDEVVVDANRSSLHVRSNGRSWDAEVIDEAPLFGGLRCRALDHIAEVAGELKALRPK